MTTIHDVATVRRPALRPPGYAPTPVARADAKTMAEALAVIALLVVAVGAAAMAIAAFFA